MLMFHLLRNLLSLLFISHTFSFTLPSTTISSFNRIKYYGKTHSITLHTTSDNDERYSNSISIFDDIGTELWLDLRGSSILPHVAIDYILESLDEEQTYDDDEENKKEEEQTYDDEEENEKDIIISKVLLSLIDYEKFFRQIEAAPSTRNNFDIIIVNDNQELLLLSENNTVYGEVFCIDDDNKVLNDLMSAINLFTQGKWIAIDSSEITNDDEKKESVNNALQLITSVAKPSLDLILNDKKQNIEDDTKKHDVGGIAINCNSNSDLLYAGATLQSLGSSDISVNGILLAPSSDNNEESASSALKDINSAVILPFDVSLWKSASLVFR